MCRLTCADPGRDLEAARTVSEVCRASCGVVGEATPIPSQMRQPVRVPCVVQSEPPSLPRRRWSWQRLVVELPSALCLSVGRRKVVEPTGLSPEEVESCTLHVAHFRGPPCRRGGPRHASGLVSDGAVARYAEQPCPVGNALPRFPSCA